MWPFGRWSPGPFQSPSPDRCHGPPMPRLRIRHESVYSYDAPTTFGRWRLLMRPVDTHATRLIKASLETPPCDLTWTYDAYGNCVCLMQPDRASTQLKVVNNLLVNRYPSPLANVETNNP